MIFIRLKFFAVDFVINNATRHKCRHWKFIYFFFCCWTNVRNTTTRKKNMQTICAIWIGRRGLSLLLLVFAGSVAETYGIDFSIRNVFPSWQQHGNICKSSGTAEGGGCMKSVNILKLRCPYRAIHRCHTQHTCTACLCALPCMLVVMLVVVVYLTCVQNRVPAIANKGKKYAYVKNNILPGE